jgi:iron complex outermembrane receptor protein
MKILARPPGVPLLLSNSRRLIAVLPSRTRQRRYLEARRHCKKEQGEIMRRHCLALLALPLLAHAGDPPSFSEKDFLTDLPVVLSVSRLPQPIDETPGAVTIIDRDMIRLSGARNIVDLFRLVPGFQVSDSVYYGAPHPAYHGTFSELSNRMQVLVDGRSVYSAFRGGDVGQGLQTLALEDIERIEVIRGSDSAAYGARAVLGVVNILTKDPVETHGLLVGKSAGGNGINDSLVRLGWGDETRNFRLTAERRGDDGLAGVNGANHLENFNFRADFRPNVNDEWQLRVGNSSQYTGTGRAGDPNDVEREVRVNSGFLQLDWRRTLGPVSDLAISYSHNGSSESDNFWYALPFPFNGTTIDFGGRANDDALSIEHTFSPADRLRFVWGVELRNEEVRSFALYNTPRVSTHFRRLFGNLEFRIGPDLLLNAGGMLEHNSLSGSDSSPRLVLNWHVIPGQTFRIGSSTAHRPPSMFEKAGDIRYVVNGILLDETVVARGQVRPETIRASEIGYLAEFPVRGDSLDVRIFHERIDGIIQRSLYAIPDGTKLLPPSSAFDYVNGPGFSIRGIEYQLKLHVSQGAQLLLNQSLLRSDAADKNIADSIPTHESSILLSNRFVNGAELSLGHYRSAAYTWQSAENLLVATHRTDLRLAMPFRVGSTRCEGAVTVQNLGQPYNDFLPTFQFRRQAFASLAAQF